MSPTAFIIISRILVCQSANPQITFLQVMDLSGVSADNTAARSVRYLADTSSNDVTAALVEAPAVSIIG